MLSFHCQTKATDNKPRELYDVLRKFLRNGSCIGIALAGVIYTDDEARNILCGILNSRIILPLSL
jgi:hypothetical protein